MCGIIAYTGTRDAAPILIAGLRRLEYRGYDSSGIALHTRGKLKVHRAAGKLQQLEAILPAKLAGKSGMGHTRWATHGQANDQNAHPHVDSSNSIAIIHNGIIENAAALRAELEAGGTLFLSDTDSEVIAHLIAAGPRDSLVDAVRQALARLHGTYGLVVMSASKPGELVAARNGSPVIVGLGEKEMFVTSDANAILEHTREIIHLEDGELAVINDKGCTLTTPEALVKNRPSITVEHDIAYLEKDGHAHFMLKEIVEQPESVERTLKGRLDRRFSTAHLGGLNMTPRELLDIKRIKILGCGSAYYAGMSGAHMLEQVARIAADAEPAAEFRYRNPIIEPDTLYIVVSQSGETFDTLAALREIQRKGGRVLGINNVVGSTIAREVEGGIYMHAGPEVSVASTKAYSSMLACFMLLALQLGRVRDISPQQGTLLIDAIEGLPAHAAAAHCHLGLAADLRRHGPRGGTRLGRRPPGRSDCAPARPNHLQPDPAHRSHRHDTGADPDADLHRFPDRLGQAGARVGRPPEFAETRHGDRRGRRPRRESADGNRMVTGAAAGSQSDPQCPGDRTAADADGGGRCVREPGADGDQSAASTAAGWWPDRHRAAACGSSRTTAAMPR